MCGRYAASRGAEDLVEELGLARDATGGRLRPTYNAAPTSQRAIVRASAVEDGLPPARGDAPPRRELALAGWGLVPFFAKDPGAGARMINARSETVTEKPAYRRAVRRSRVLVPVDGWYEWQRGTDGDGRPIKVAHYMSSVSGGTVLLAGIAETWRPRGDDQGVDPVLTFSILTRDARGVLATIHDRTPLVVPADLHDDWLDPAIDEREDVAGLLAAALGDDRGEATDGDGGPRAADGGAADGGDLQAYPVGRAVGNVRTDGPGLVEPIGPPLT